MRYQQGPIDDGVKPGVIVLDQSLDEFLPGMQIADFFKSAIAVIDTRGKVLYQNAAFDRLSRMGGYANANNQQPHDMFSQENVQIAIGQCVAEPGITIFKHTFKVDRLINMELNITLQPIKTKNTPSIQALLVAVGEESVTFDRFHIERLRQDKKELVERIEVISKDLIQKSNLVRDLLHETPFAIMLFDSERNLLQMNSACEKLFWTSTRKSMGLKCDQFLYCYQKNNRCPLLGDGNQIIQSETTTCRPRVPETTLLRSAVILEHEDKEKIILEAFVDISDRKRTEQALKDSHASLEAKNTELERFVYTISHELKSPLVSISGFTGLLDRDLKEGNSDRVNSDMQQINAAIGTMSILLDDLVELSRTGHVISSPETVSLDDLVQEVVSSNAPQIAKRDIAVRIAADLPNVCADRVRLREVLQNIIENSIKFMGDQPEPQIEIGARDDGTEMVCYISDNGIGIDPAYHKRIFGLFDRLDLQIEGTGVGLALAHRIIGLHGGRIWVESDGVSKGSTFFFTIPKSGKADSESNIEQPDPAVDTNIV